MDPKAAGPKLVSMKRSNVRASLPSPHRDDYPYGVALRLENEELDKLGMKGMPEVGSKFEVIAEAKVTGSNESKNDEGPSDRGLTLQITGLALKRTFGA